MNSNKEMNEIDRNDANLDPLSNEIGAHPLGTGVGAASAGTVATLVGATVGGPVGGAGLPWEKAKLAVKVLVGKKLT